MRRITPTVRQSSRCTFEPRPLSLAACARKRARARARALAGSFGAARTNGKSGARARRAR